MSTTLDAMAQDPDRAARQAAAMNAMLAKYDEEDGPAPVPAAPRPRPSVQRGLDSGSYLGIGVMIQVVAGVAIGVGMSQGGDVTVAAGVIAAAVGSLVTLVGAIALGVLVGLRERDLERARAVD